MGGWRGWEGGKGERMVRWEGARFLAGLVQDFLCGPRDGKTLITSSASH